MLMTASMLEYREAVEIYRAARAGAIANKTQQIKFPLREEGYYAQLLKELEMYYPELPSAIFI
jgi:exonuclease VII large subunit